jgi:ammonium transporter Rh
LYAKWRFSCSLYLQFPARAPHSNSSALNDVNEVLMFLEPGDNRSALQQAGFQLAALMVTMVVAIVGGLLTGTYNSSRIFHARSFSAKGTNFKSR